MKTAAFFDFDDTIVHCNSGLGIIFGYFINLRMSPFYAVTMVPKYIWYLVIGKQQPDRFFKYLYKFLKGRDYEKETKWCAEYFQKHVEETIYKDAKRKINWHQEQGHKVFIVTNSLEMMVGRAKKILKTGLIGSTLELKDGKITGKSERICFGANKAKLIKELAIKKNIDLKSSYAYSDNNSDIPLLSAVGNPVATNPQWRMLAHAKKNNWKILYFRG